MHFGPEDDAGVSSQHSNTQSPAPGVAAEVEAALMLAKANGARRGDDWDNFLESAVIFPTQARFESFCQALRTALQASAAAVEPVGRVGVGPFSKQGPTWFEFISGKTLPDGVHDLYTAPPLPAQVQAAESRDDILLSVIQRLNWNPYSLTKSECISEVQAMRIASRTPAPGMAGGVGAEQ